MLEEILRAPGVALEIGQITIATKDRITETDFEAICREHPDLNLEQRASGELVIMSPHGGESSAVCTEISFQLKAWAKRGRLGKVFDSNALFLLPDGSKLSPDISLLVNAKWRGLWPKQRQGFLPVVPDFVVEVVSPSDKLKASSSKMDDWMRNGVELGWLLDLRAGKIWIYEASQVREQPLTQDVVGSGPVEGFVLSVKDLYESIE